MNSLLPYKNSDDLLKKSPEYIQFLAEYDVYNKYVTKIFPLPDEATKHTEFIRLYRQPLIDLLEQLIRIYGFDDIIKLVNIMIKLIPSEDTSFTGDERQLRVKYNKIFMSNKFSPSTILESLKHDIEKHISKKATTTARGGGQADPPRSSKRRRARRRNERTVGGTSSIQERSLPPATQQRRARLQQQRLQQ